MAPKQSPLKALQKQSAAQQKLTSAIAGSAYGKLSHSNAEINSGKRRRFDEDESEPMLHHEPVRKIVKRSAVGEEQLDLPIETREPQRRKVTKTKLSVTEEPKEPVIESWLPAGGELLQGYDERDANFLSPTLGIARISTWRLETFTKSLKALIEHHALLEEITTDKLFYGGESVTDVYFRFRNELVAEAVKEKVDGAMVDGRKLQVAYI
ncbi:hypothetical protein LTR37_005134 [Vermiconidia calcicola]|uniref:Uncharacterized protein n=1 Tax=Vermiconidia calcicola TaxID=1690605 RepID=A0ACC3NKJ8_9PEZI|nr:hypothetical protein LTR37_005134 [Vermiconidia calcicola]